MNVSIWPPSDDLLRWRPSTTAPNDELLIDGGEDATTVPAYALAHVETDAGRPGGAGISHIYAVPTPEGDLRIVVANDDDLPFTSPIDRSPELPTLGELLRILDETELDGEVIGVGHPTRVMNDVNGDREELRGFLRISSDLYPQLEALDQSRFEQWVAERQ